MKHSEFLAREFGSPKWVLATRATDNLRRRYPESVIVTPKRYREAELAYRREFGDPYDKVRAQMYLALLAAEQYIGGEYAPDISFLEQVRAAIRAEQERK